MAQASCDKIGHLKMTLMGRNNANMPLVGVLKLQNFNIILLFRVLDIVFIMWDPSAHDKQKSNKEGLGSPIQQLSDLPAGKKVVKLVEFICLFLPSKSLSLIHAHSVATL